MSEVCLKVRWGPSKSYKLMSFDINKTCAEISEELQQRYSLTKEQYKLYTPPSESREHPIWCEDSKKLSSYNLNDRVYL